MASYIVAYDLFENSIRQQRLAQRLQAMGARWTLRDHVCFVTTELSASALMDHLEDCIGESDELFLAKLSGQAAWAGLHRADSEWLRAHLGR
ncbi:MAG TPA: hypothetical protein VJ947_06180 [Pseudohaliea sp.]|nr:hypothetical protein [Pseudohaliea sp.]